VHVICLFAAATLAILLLLPMSLGANDVPRVLPDRIDDVLDGAGIPFPRFDNLSWRIFLALNWPALTDAAQRGTKKLSDPILRVKSYTDIR
jgi:hypothetical protein